MNSCRLLASFFLILLLSACGTSAPEDADPLTPMPPTVSNEPSDEAVRVAMSTYLKENHAPCSSMYDINRVDLDGDDRRDALVLLKNPYGFWCDVNGCPMLVFHANREDFTLVNAIQDVRGPIYISSQNSNGWRDIMMRISGRWSETKDVAMQYDGSQYPAHPDVLPAYEALAQNTASKIFR